MITPRDLLLETWLTRVPLIKRAGEEVKVPSLCLEPINTNLAVAISNVSLFAISHFRMFSKSMLKGYSDEKTRFFKKSQIRKETPPILNGIHINTSISKMRIVCIHSGLGMRWTVRWVIYV